MEDSSGHSRPVTRDGRYLIVRDRLWRRSDPSLTADERQRLVGELMGPRGAVAAALRSADGDALGTAHMLVDRTKRALGKRGPMWSSDGTPDLNRHMVHATPYADWFASLTAGRK